MIDELRLRNVGVIEEAGLVLGPGLSVLTGETGAGKTMVLTGLGLLMGRRPDPRLVRHGSEQGEVEGVLTARDEAALRAWVEPNGGVLDDGALLASRVVPAAGRARAYLGGRSVPAATLAELADHFITVHGQADQQRLRSASHQRVALDEFAGLDGLLERYRAAFEVARRLETDLRDWEDSARRVAGERVALREGLAAIDQVTPHPGEDDELRQRAERLTNIEELRSAVETAYGVLGGDGVVPGVLDRLAFAGHALEGAVRLGPELREWAQLVEEANGVLSQVATEIGIQRGELEADPGLLDEIHTRRAALTALMRRFGPTLSDVIRWADAARDRLGELDEGSRDELEERLVDARATADALATELTQRRRVAAHDLERRVNAELGRLAMKDARLEVRLAAVQPGAWGRDEVSMVLAPHRNAPVLPVASAASGGELSRIMLALEVSLAVRPDDHTFVFDEVDAGIGGSAAVEVGRRLKELSRHHQVIVVTHLAQVAAFADHHLVVTKTAAGGTPRTRVERVVGPARERELARMLAGDTSPTAIRHAAELLRRVGVGT
ncbi:MAG: DNA repair protein RecN [Actinomycetota bacterium]